MVIKVLIVDDSATARVALCEALQVDPEIMVAGEADTGASALHLVKRLDPDLVTMDVYLTEENGLDVTKEIMTTAPRPILVVTGVNPADSRLIFGARPLGHWIRKTDFSSALVSESEVVKQTPIP